MMIKRTLLPLTAAALLAAALLPAACSGHGTVAGDVAIVPAPTAITVDATKAFRLTDGLTVGVKDTTLLPAAGYLVQLLSPATGYRIAVVEGTGDITLALDAQAGPAGAYTLRANRGGVDIAAADYAGAAAAIQTLRQLLPPEIEARQRVEEVDWAIPAVTIADQPRYGWRGLLLDVSRHFYSTEEVKELLDLMALYKLNTLHWHLTDDQGWRIEIKQYPLLTEKGAWRKLDPLDRECMRRAAADGNPDFLLPADKLRVVEGDTLYGGFYTQEEIREVVAYAAVRGIVVVPEVDMPGHFAAAIDHYPFLSCAGQWGWGTPVCPGKDTTIEFCKNVYREVFSLFPGKYVHIGGDEVGKANWKRCPDCQRRMRANGLRTEEELQAWFTHDMEAFFNEHGKVMIGWDEIIEGGLSPTATVMWWRSAKKDVAVKATASGNRVVCVPNSHFYLDYQEGKNSIPDIYGYDPAEGLDSAQRALILGVQGNVWCEFIPSNDRMQYMAVPRMLAIAELAWTSTDQKDYGDFRRRIAAQFARLNLMGVNYRIPDLAGVNTINTFIDSLTVDLDCMDPTATIRYTTDGTAPTAESTLYTGSLTINESADYTFCTFRPDGRRGDTTRARFVKSDYSPASKAEPKGQGLDVAWHDFTGTTCADIGKARLKGRYTMAEIAVPEEVQGNVGLVFRGYLNVPADGIYTFAVNSDDGSTLAVDGELIVDNDGLHGPIEVVGQKALAKGYHPMELRYFDRYGGILGMRVTDGDGNLLDAARLFAH